MLLSPSISVATASPELLSIEGIDLPPRGYVEAFSIETWGVRVLAVCHLPPGWTITAGKSADPSGTLAGEASLGVTFLDQKALEQLHGLFLVDLDEAFRLTERRAGASTYPATFKGKLIEGTYGPDNDLHDVPLKQANIVRMPASRCP